MNFRIARPDAKNWTLEELVPGGIHQRTKKRGPDKWRVIGYFGGLEDLLSHLINRQLEVPEGTLETQIRDLLAELKTVEERLLRMFPAEPEPAGAATK